MNHTKNVHTINNNYHKCKPEYMIWDLSSHGGEYSDNSLLGCDVLGDRVLRNTGTHLLN
jgi:hypothetical protein